MHGIAPWLQRGTKEMKSKKCVFTKMSNLVYKTDACIKKKKVVA